MTSWSLPSSLLFFILKGEREGSFILFFQVDLDFSLRGVFTTWAVHVRGKNWDFGKELSGKILISLGSVVSKSPLSNIRAIGIINMDMAGEQRGPGP